MRRLSLVVLNALLVHALSPRPAFARDIPDAVLVGDFGLHVVGAGHHQTLSRWLTGQILLDLYAPWTQNLHLLGSGNEPDADVIGGVVRVRVFVHPFGNAPRGFWLSPFTQLGPVWATRAGETRTGVAGATGISAGYSFWLRDRVLLALGAGAQYHAAAIPGGRTTPSFAGFYPTVDIMTGYAF